MFLRSVRSRSRAKGGVFPVEQLSLTRDRVISDAAYCFWPNILRFHVSTARVIAACHHFSCVRVLV
jgi:hypothetical protein